MKKFDSESMIGEKYGVYTIIKYLKFENGKHYVLVRCECGNEKVMSYHNLKDKRKSNNWCEKCRNPKDRKRLKSIYKGMKTRCFNPNSKSYKNYGGKGITVCNEWSEDFNVFYRWALDNGYKEGLTIDRIDSNKDYCPDNCRWISKSENSTLANLGREYSGYSNVTAISPEGLIYENITNISEFGRIFGLDTSCIRKVCNGEYSNHKGWKFFDNN